MRNRRSTAILLITMGWKLLLDVLGSEIRLGRFDENERFTIL